ncbi:TPA: cell division protein FtsK [Patescibacteria group bacterium]|nr:cell division protein FtsK [Patescibacteria group bacterium]
MSRKKNKKNKKENSSQFFDDFRLHPETKKSVWAVVFIGVAIILFLASFKSAGPFGNFAYAVFEKLFGLGYYLLPLIFLIMAGVFLASERRRIYAVTFLGAAMFVLAGLGLIDIIFPGQGGLTGETIGFLEIIFGYWAAIIVALIIIIISLIVIFNFQIKIPKKLKSNEGDKETLEKVEVAKVEEAISATGGGNNNEEVELEKEAEQISIKEGIAQVIGFKQKKSALIGNSSVNYIAPPLDLLRSSVEKPTVGDLRASANIIKRTLEGFGISVEMGEINIGPKVTRYTLKPAEGVKLSRITALNSDLALALAAHPIRIEAPIPGKSLVGIEVPNKSPSIVRLRTLLEAPGYTETQNPLIFPLGRDVMGSAIFTDISKLPHLLVAGATGTGKSIFIHSAITSLIYRNSPQNLRFILIDPKRVELSTYENIPYLLSPVITEGKKAILALKWAISEMERRYDLLLAEHSRDIYSYNQKIGHLKEKTLPYIIIFIDELADLMATYGKELEAMIIRLSQMARATGIHLIVSTQRPSVEVITGLIKANITARVAFQVASQVDSRTILDAAGAEKLLGRGDSLFISADTSKPKRIQGPFISEKESERVVAYLKEKGQKLLGEDYGYDPELSEMLTQDFSSSEETLFDVGDDELYQEAYDVVVKAGKASASLLQRHLRVGYARAARLLDLLEARGVVGPSQGAKPRDVFYAKEGFSDQSPDSLKPESDFEKDNQDEANR